MAKGGGASSDRVKDLVARGFTKTRATQALKDAGNNFQVALRILESQQDRATSAAASTANGRGPGQPLAQCGVNPSRAAVSKVPTESREARRRHPCIVQYKSCQYGQYCRLKDYPGDTCIQYFHGSCVFGDTCTHRHFIDGVDIREGLRPEMEEILTTGDGTFRIVDTADGKVQLAERLPEAPAEDTGLSRLIYVPQQSDFNRVRGAEPTHTDPYAAPLATSIAVERPKPFLESLKRGLNDSTAARAQTSTPPVRVAAVDPTRDLSRAAATADLHGPTRSGRKKHPCIAQFGTCKFGDTCNHADRDADVCVHFLNGRCRFKADTCRYRHETEEEYMQKLVAELDATERDMDHNLSEAEQDGADGDTWAGAEPSSSSKHKHRLQSCGMDGAPQRNAQPLTTPAETEQSLFASAFVAATDAVAPAPARREPNPYLLKEAQRRPFTASEFLPRELMTDDEEEGEFDEYGDDGDDYSHNGAAGSAENPQDDAEMEKLLRLLEVFPAADPLVVMQAVRSCNGDPTAAAEMLTRVSSLESREEGVDEVLAQALLEEEKEVNATTEREAAARCESLLTLCVLFPKVEPSGIEAILQRCQDDFHSAYGVLLCAQENLSRRAYGHYWTGQVNPAEGLRLARLESMFPDVHPDIVRSTFGNCDKSTPKTIDALNQLTSELLSLETRESLGEDATRWRPHAVLARPSSSSSAQDVACPVPTSEELAEAYRDAERECRELGDWRRVRERAYLVNTARIRMLALASAAFANNEGRVAKLLSREGKDLGREYARLNRLAMLALERERLAVHPTSTLDVHGFHVPEAVEVLFRRVDLCRKRRIHHLTVIVGEGKHSRREGHSSIYPALLQHIREDPYFKRHVQIRSIKPSFLELSVRPME